MILKFARVPLGPGIFLDRQIPDPDVSPQPFRHEDVSPRDLKIAPRNIKFTVSIEISKKSKNLA